MGPPTQAPRPVLLSSAFHMPILPVPCMPSFTLNSDARADLYIGEDGVICLGALDAGEGVSEEIQWRTTGEHKKMPILRSHDYEEGIWLDPPEDPEATIVIGHRGRGAQVLSPLPCYTHRLRLDNQGIQSLVRYTRDFTVEIEGTEAEYDPSRFRVEQMDEAGGRLRVAVLPDASKSEGGDATLSFPDSDSIVVVHVVEHTSSVKVQVVQGEAPATDSLVVRMILRGHRETKVLLRSTSGIPLQQVLLTPGNPLSEIAVQEPISGLIVETTEQLASRRRRELPIERPVLSCWPPTIRWNGEQLCVAVGVTGFVGDGAQLQAVLPPALANVSVRRGERPGTFVLGFPHLAVDAGLIEAIRFFDRADEAWGSLPVVGAHSGEQGITS